MAMPQKARSAATGAKAPPPPAAAGETQPTVEAISARAYAIWQAAGCPQGCDAEHWYQAEAELRARR